MAKTNKMGSDYLPTFLVLLDGPRGAGKSTVGNALVQKLHDDGWPLVTYFKKVKRDPDNEYQNMMDHITEWTQFGGIVVVDRFALSEWTMSIVHNRRTDYAQLTLDCRLALNVARECGFAAILTADAEELDRRINHRNEQRGWDMPVDVVNPIWRAAAATFDVEIIDTTKRSMDDVVNILSKTVNALYKGYREKTWEEYFG